MRRLTFVLAACVLTAAPKSAHGQQRSVTLAEAIQLAEKAAPNVVQALGTVRATGAGVRAAWGEYLPRLSTNASYGSSFSDGPSRTDPITGEVIPGGSSSSSLTVGASGSIDIFTGFRRGASMSSAKANRTDAEAALAFERAQSALTTTNQFLQALQGADLVRVRQDAIRRAQEKLAIANARLSTRGVTIADSLQAVVDLTGTRLQLLNDERALTEAEANLARYLGLDGRVAAVTDSSLFRTVTIADANELMAEAMERSPQVIRAVAAVRLARANLGLTRSAYFPAITLSGSTSYGGSDRNSYNLFNNRSVNLGVQWQLFNGFARERDMTTRRASLEAAEAREADARRQIGASLTTYLAALRTAQERTTLTQQNLESARASAQVQTERYRLGSIGIVELNAAQDALSRAETDAVSARYDYLRAKTQIEATLGRTL
ncbi:MAG: TolC family protein [Gemmatimonadales bacterium]|nr:TolC family protein [Gemmatimonadales bacterium]